MSNTLTYFLSHKLLLYSIEKPHPINSLEVEVEVKVEVQFTWVAGGVGAGGWFVGMRGLP